METLSIYEKAIDALVQDFSDDGPIYLTDEKSLSNHFRTRKFRGRKIVFFNSANEKDELKKNGNLFRLYEIEFPSIIKDTLQLKINHMVICEIDLRKSENDWPRKLSAKEREVIRAGIAKCRSLEGSQEIKTYSTMIQYTWTYVTFRADYTLQEFRIEKIETKTM